MAKRKFGDREDAVWVKDIPPLQTLMAHTFIHRTDCEAFLQDELDITEVVKYLEEKNKQHPQFKTTVFHAIIFAISKIIYERPKMNYFIQGRRFYSRKEISAGFVAKRKFADHAEEALMFFTPKEDDRLEDLSRKIAGEVNEMRKSDHATGGMDEILAKLCKAPRIFLMLFMRIIRILDFWGKLPKSLRTGDPNFSSVFLTNLGSIGCPSIYHHLNNYGSNSFMVAVGLMKDKLLIMPDGSEQVRKVIDIGFTIDERIADGFYFVRSLKLLRHMMCNPEMFDQTMATPSGVEY